ncbi:MAG: O-antigen ligase family protein [Bacteroidota bacterium]|nr:O-antigen ligase family protein [Bacteroidota bacterium]
MKLLLKQNAAYIIFLIFFLFAPLFGGLFYKGAVYSSLILLCIITILLFTKAQRVYMDVKLLVLFSVQLILTSISAINGINREDAIFGFFKIMFVPILFVLALNLENLKFGSTNRNDQSQAPLKGYNLLLNFLFLTGFVISIINVSLSLMKRANLKNYRADAVLGYANTLALYVFVCSIIGFYLYYGQERTRIFRVAIKLGIFFDITVLVLTYSRTMWVLSLLLYICFLLYIRKSGSIIDAVLLISVSIVSGIVISYGKMLIGIPLFLALLIFLIYYEYSLRTRFISLIGYNDFWKRKALSKAIFTVVILILIAAVSFLGSTYLIRRVASIGFGATELQERFAYYKDALSIIKDYPIIGTGAGGWGSIQFKYQTALYSVRYVHSSIFQAALDYGIAGLSMFLMQIAVFILYAVKTLKQSTGRKIKSAVILCIVCNSAILLHSVLDFDLEFSLITMIFWINVAFLSRLSGNAQNMCTSAHSYNKNMVKLSSACKTAVAAILTVCVILILSLDVSDFFYKKGTASYNSKNFKKAEEYLDRAVIFNPFSSNAYYAKAKTLLSGNKENEPGVLNNTVRRLAQAEKYDYFNPVYAETLADAYDNVNNFGKSAKEYGKLIRLSPMRIGYYEGLSESLMAMAEIDLKSKRLNDAKRKWSRIIETEKHLKEARFRISPNAGKLKHKLILKITPELAYNIGRAYLYLNDTTKAVKYLKIASEGKNIPENWLLK